MLEVLKFIFSSFWIWLGTCILVGSFGGLLRISIRRPTKSEDK